MTYDDLFPAKPEAVRRLARMLGIATDGKGHADLCREVARWHKRNPQARRTRVGATEARTARAHAARTSVEGASEG